MLDRIRAVFERFGFAPIETPSVERNAVLTAKGGAETERQIYSLTSLHPQSDDDSRDYSLHFDLTVPLARYVAQHNNELTFPFRRYQMQKVWRGERPQHGRYREFMQCDIDIVGDGKLSLMADAEIPAVISNVFTSLDIGAFTIRISNRKILTGYLMEHLGFDEQGAEAVREEADKIESEGTRPLIRYLQRENAPSSTWRDIIKLAQMEGSSAEILDNLTAMRRDIGGMFALGVDELKAVFAHTAEFGIPDENISVDLGIMRGLDYYTGTIYETRLNDYPQLGSICSGGRYDDLASYFIGKTLPGVGISIGLTRLFSQLLQAEIVKPDAATTAQALVTVPDAALMGAAIAAASALREGGVNTEIFFEGARLGRQLRYASRKGFRFAVIPLPEDLEQGRIKLRDMRESDEQSVAIADLPKEIARRLSQDS